jgi:hypothetical protein
MFLGREYYVAKEDSRFAQNNLKIQLAKEDSRLAPNNLKIQLAKEDSRLAPNNLKILDLFKIILNINFWSIAQKEVST